MNSPASFPITRLGSRGLNRRPAGAIATHSVRNRLVPVPIRSNSYYTDNGGSATATLSTLAFYQPWGNTLLSVSTTYVATGASGMRVFVPFTGTSFGVGLIRDATITANDGLFEVTVDGVVYPIRRNDLQLASLDLTGLGTYSVSDVCGICEDLDDGTHLAILHFPGPVSGESPQTWYIGAWLLDENAGNVQGLRGIQANIANSRTAMPTVAAAIVNLTSGSRPPQAVTEVWFRRHPWPTGILGLWRLAHTVRQIPHRPKSALAFNSRRADQRDDWRPCRSEFRRGWRHHRRNSRIRE